MIKWLALVSAVALLFAAQGATTTEAEVGRLYISPITGDGTDDNPFRALICDLLVAPGKCRNSIGSDLAEGTHKGHPLRDWTIAYVESSSWTAVEANNQIFLVRFDEDVNAVMPQTVRTRIQQSGALTNQEMTAGMTYRQALELMLFKQYGHTRVWDEWPEIFSAP